MVTSAVHKNFHAAFGQSRDAEFRVTDCLEGVAPDSQDLVLCNPPFHLGHTVDDYAGRRLLTQCARQLAPGGRLYLVANRHLDYSAALRRHCSSVERLAGDGKFNLWLGHKR